MFDTASTYVVDRSNQDGAKSLDSEDRYGKFLPAYRNQIILSTKLESRNPEKAKYELDASLKRLKTDYVDILFIHAILPSDNTAEIEKGLYKTMVSFKSSGMIKNSAKPRHPIYSAGSWKYGWQVWPAHKRFHGPVLIIRLLTNT